MINLIESNDLSDYQDFGRVDIKGESCQTLREFYEELAKKLYFPDYFAFNLDSLDEMLCDLSWIEDQKLLISIDQSELFLIKERNPVKIATILDLLDAAAEELKWYEEDAKTVVYAFGKSDYINQLLSQG